jgi:hypothetical protein
VRPIIHTIARALFHAGGLGLLTLGAFDSSPLVVPMGNDLLALALCARYHERMLYGRAGCPTGRSFLRRERPIFSLEQYSRGLRALRSIAEGGPDHLDLLLRCQHLRISPDKRANRKLNVPSDAESCLLKGGC